MAYSRYRPRGPLQLWVSSVWVQKSSMDASVHPFPPTRVLPTGCVDVTFCFREPFAEITGSGANRLPPAVLTGPQAMYQEYAATGRTGIVLVRFRPGAASACLSVPLHEVRDRNVDLRDCVAAWRVEATTERIRRATSDAERITHALAFFESLLQPSAVGTAVLGAVSRIEQRHGCERIPSLARAAGVSSRQMQRWFRDEVGLSPKTLGRIVRFQHALDLRTRGRSWSMAALDAGYQDQSHLANECRRLSGLSPGHLFQKRRATPLADFYNQDGGDGEAQQTTYL